MSRSRRLRTGFGRLSPAALLLSAAVGLVAALLATPAADAAAPASTPWIHTYASGHLGFQLFWWDGATAERDPSVTGYDVQYRVQGTAWQSWPHSGTLRAVEFSNLNAGTEYQVRVRATNSDGAGSWSAIEYVPAVVSRPTTPNPPFPVQVEAGDGEARVSWGRPSWSGGQTLTGYVIRLRISGATTVLRRIAVSGGGATSKLITGLTNDTPYTVDVFATAGETTHGRASPYVEFTPAASLRLSAGVVVSPTTLSVPVGSRACYLVRPLTEPSAALTLTATSGDTDTATVAAVDMSQQLGSNGSQVNWKVGQAYCVTGVAAGSVTISHSVASDDSNFDGASIPSVSVTVTTADTTPVVRFLHSELRVVEGSSGRALAPGSVHGLGLKRVTVKIDVAPAPTSTQWITWWIPHPHCTSGCKGGYDGSASYGVDYVTSGLIARQIRLAPNSNNAEFEFLIRSDSEQESDETVRIFLLPRRFVEGTGIIDNHAVCIGSCSSPTRAQQSVVVRIIDDDAGGIPERGTGNAPPQQGGEGTEGDLGVVRNPNAQNEHAGLIADVTEWRNDPCCESSKAHTDRWDRVLLALGESVADGSLQPMTAAEAQGYADRGWTRWTQVAETLRALEAAAQIE